MPLNQDENNREKLANTAFISEKIKQRPINRKKLLMRTVITVSLAVVFGIVACFTFLFLQPVVYNFHFFPQLAFNPERVFVHICYIGSLHRRTVFVCDLVSY